MAHRQLGRVGVVGGEGDGGAVLEPAVDADIGDGAVFQQLEDLGVEVLQGVAGGAEHYSAGPEVQQGLQEVALLDAARQGRADHGPQAVRGQREADPLGHRAEDRDRQPGGDHPDDAAGGGAALVADLLHGALDQLTGLLRHAGLAVEHPTDGGHADTGVLRDLGDPDFLLLHFPAPNALIVWPVGRNYVIPWPR